MTTYEDVHAGALVLGHDNEVWGVAEIRRSPVLAVTLVRDEGRVRVTGYPPAGTPVTVVQAADVGAEATAAQTLMDAGLGPIEIVGEVWR
jgi:hypothetical protein